MLNNLKDKTIFFKDKEESMNNQQNYYYIIPAKLVEDGNPTKALLYGLITSLTNKEGYCWATNKYLAEKLGKKDASIIRTYLTELESEGWIQIKDRDSRSRKIIIDKKTVNQPAEKTAGSSDNMRKKPQVESQRAEKSTGLSGNVWKNPQVIPERAEKSAGSNPTRGKNRRLRAEKTAGQRAEKTAPSNINMSNISEYNSSFSASAEKESGRLALKTNTKARADETVKNGEKGREDSKKSINAPPICSLYPKVKDKKGLFPFFCREFRRLLYCNNDPTFCTKYFNQVKRELNEMGLEPSHPQYYAIFTNRLKNVLYSETKGVIPDIRKKNNEMASLPAVLRDMLLKQINQPLNPLIPPPLQ